MRGLDLRASRVHQIATQLLESKTVTQEPPWYKAIGRFPPGEFLTRTQPVQHRPTNIHPKKRKPSKMFQPQIIEYEEDKLRQEFYSDHPWELARPRIVLEKDGMDSYEYDWSKIEQVNKPLDGESVVQRQLWLMANIPGMTQTLAYEKARKEFYDLRLAEDIERRVAKEEAQWYGACFGPGPIEWSATIEDKMYESWKAWAEKRVEENRIKEEAGLYHDNDATIEEDTALNTI